MICMEEHKWTVFTNRLQWRIFWYMGEQNEGDSWGPVYFVLFTSYDQDCFGIVWCRDLYGM